MVLFRILCGKKAGAVWEARRFPVRLGRAADSDLQIEEDGVWDKHLTLAFRTRDGFVLSAVGEALATVNDEPVRETLLRNGDLVSIGSARLQFWLRPASPGPLALREAFAWSAILLVSLGQAGLLYWLLR